MKSSISLIQKLAWVYAVLFLVVVALGYIPGFTDADGALFGLFHIEPKDDLLHLGSAIWAAVAAWLSTRASLFYFRLFGIVYLLDGVVGLLLGQGYLDGGIFLNGPTSLPLSTRIGANAPHILIGGIAVYIGFVLGRKYAGKA